MQMTANTFLWVYSGAMRSFCMPASSCTATLHVRYWTLTPIPYYKRCSSSAEPMQRRAHRRKAEVQSASLPWQVGEWALLLLLVEGPQELQVYLSVLGHQSAILQPELWGNLAYSHNHLDGHIILSMHSFRNAWHTLYTYALRRKCADHWNLCWPEQCHAGLYQSHWQLPRAPRAFSAHALCCRRCDRKVI